MAFEIKVGATKPKLRVRVRNADGSVPSLGGSTVKFSMKLEGAAVYKIENADAEVEDPDDAVLAYDWADDGTDTDTPGFYLGEFTDENGDGLGVYPNKRYVRIQINPRL